MWAKLIQIWKLRDLRNSILKVLGILVVFRIAAHIPIPGVDLEALRRFFQSNQILGLMNVFSGGTMENFSVVMAGVGPYITASIVLQLLGMVVPSIEELSKEGEAGRRKINHWTRLLTVPLSFLQSYGMIAMLRQSGGVNIITDLDATKLFLMMLTMTAGTVFLMWLGEIISEEKIGNGISIMIFAGIASAIPGAIQRTAITFSSAQILSYAVYAVIALVTIAGVVLISEAQRNIPVTYAKQVRGSSSRGGASTHLPLRVNTAGVIPIIFAISIILIPPMIGQFFVQAKTAWVAAVAKWTVSVFNDQTFYAVSFFVLVFAFTYFYTAVVFKPDQIADNLQKQGGYVPGIRPGKPTAEYLQYVMTRITLAGAVAIALIAVLPIIIQQAMTGARSMIIGGSSLLIVVSVVMEIVRQIESQMTMREYEDVK